MSTRQPPDQTGASEAGPFRRFGWALAVLGLLLVVLCAGVTALEASAGDRSILARLRASAGVTGPIPTPILPGDQPVSAPTTTLAPASTAPPPTDIPSPTRAVTATRASVSVTCTCKGATYTCSDGSANANSPRCLPKATPVCSCSGNDWVCSDGSRSVNDLRCGVVCMCKGNDLYCNDGTIGYYNPECACRCDGTTMICNDGGRLPNAAFCGGSK